MNERDSIHGNTRDIYTLLYIRRSIMDNFWILETSTVSGNSHPEDLFLVHTSISNDGYESEDLETEECPNKRFWISRDGYHLMVIPFECDL